MLSQYIQAAMRHARYEILNDDGAFYGEIPPCRGVWANAPTLEGCREELQEVLRIGCSFECDRACCYQSLMAINLLMRILRQAGVSREEWEAL